MSNVLPINETNCPRETCIYVNWLMRSSGFYLNWFMKSLRFYTIPELVHGITRFLTEGSRIHVGGTEAARFSTKQQLRVSNMFRHRVW